MDFYANKYFITKLYKMNTFVYILILILFGFYCDLIYM